GGVEDVGSHRGRGAAARDVVGPSGSGPPRCRPATDEAPGETVVAGRAPLTPRPRPVASRPMPPDILTMYAQGQPDKPAVIDDRPDCTLIQWSYAELNATANRLAHVLQDHGAGPKTKVVWCGQNSHSVVAVGHAARKIGATAVPLNYRL